jgi:hypothetical protein
LSAVCRTHSFFNFRDELKPILEKCASFWSQDPSKSIVGKNTSAMHDSLPKAFPLAEQIADQQRQATLEPMTEDDEDEEEEEDKKKAEESKEDVPVSTSNVEEQNDSIFERDFRKQRENKPMWKRMLADYQKLNHVLKQLSNVALGRAVASTGVASLSMSDAPDAAYGASPETIYEGKPFKEVDWFRLVDKEMELVSKVTNTEIQRVRSGLSRLRDRCELASTPRKDKNPKPKTPTPDPKPCLKP